MSTISFLVIFLLGLAGCGGGITSTVSSGSDGGGSGGEATSLNSVKAVSADISALDLANASTSQSINAGLGIKALATPVKAVTFGDAVGDKSMMGCQSRQLVNEATRLGKQISMFQCYMGAMQDNIQAFVVPEDEYAYYTFTIGGHEGGEGIGADGFSMKLRVGKNVTQSSGNSMEVQVCEGGNQMSSFILTNDGSSNLITFNMKHHFAFEPDFEEQAAVARLEEGREHFDDGDGELEDDERADLRQADAFDEWMEMIGSVTAVDGTTGAIDTIAEVEAADIDGKFDGNFGVGHMEFNYDADGSSISGPMNSVTGCFQGSFGEGDSMLGCMHAQLNTTQGSGKFSATGSFPGIPGSVLAGLPGVNTNDTSVVYCPIVDDCDPGTNFETDNTCRTQTPALSCFCMQEVASTAGCSFTAAGTEHFRVDTTGTSPQFFIAATSIFADSVAAVTLPTSVNSIEKSFGTNAWDCTAPSGEAFVTLTVDDESIFQSCYTFEDEAMENGDRDTCFQDQGEDFAAEGGDEFEELGQEMGGPGPDFTCSNPTMPPVSDAGCVAVFTQIGINMSGRDAYCIVIPNEGNQCVLTCNVNADCDQYSQIASETFRCQDNICQP